MWRARDTRGLASSARDRALRLDERRTIVVVVVMVGVGGGIGGRSGRVVGGVVGWVQGRWLGLEGSSGEAGAASRIAVWFFYTIEGAVHPPGHRIGVEVGAVGWGWFGVEDEGGCVWGVPVGRQVPPVESRFGVFNAIEGAVHPPGHRIGVEVGAVGWRGSAVGWCGLGCWV